jgi:hypothetical protein
MIRKTMIRKAVAGIVAVGLFAAAAAFVTAPLTPSTASASHYAHATGGKPHYLKGGIAKNCLDSQGECASLVW